MIANSLILQLVLLVGCACIPSGFAQTLSPNPPSLLDFDIQKKCHEIGVERQHFQEAVKQMMAIVDSAADPMVREAAAETLRDFRAVEAIPVLVRNLTGVGKSTGGGRDMVPGIEDDACALALYNIGPKAVDPLIWFIRGNASAKQIEVAACTIAAISGKKRAVSILRADVEDNAADDTRNRLYTAVKAIEALP